MNVGGDSLRCAEKRIPELRLASGHTQDLKLENIVIVAKGEDRLKITDFGESKASDVPPLPCPALPRHPALPCTLSPCATR